MEKEGLPGGEVAAQRAFHLSESGLGSVAVEIA